MPKDEPSEWGSSSRRVMRLFEFIVGTREPILAEWEAFGRTCLPASGGMDIVALRDHANEMLTVIAADLNTAQDGFEQSEKSKGRIEVETSDAGGTTFTVHLPRHAP